MMRARYASKSQKSGYKVSWKILLGALGISCLLALVAVGGAIGYSMYQAGKVNQPKASVAPPSPITPKTTSTPPPKKEVQITLAATGDVLPHDAIVKESWRHGLGSHFKPMVEKIRPWIVGADIAFFHQEVPFGKSDKDSKGYPVFKAPIGWAADTKALGYDGCSTSSNHTIDQGTKGIKHTNETLRAQGLGVTGSASSADEKRYQMYEVNKEGRSFKLAHISTAYGLNQGRVAEVIKNPWWVNLSSDGQIIVDIARQARADGADFVVASVHSGIEYNSSPSTEQDRIAHNLARSGEVDLYIGHHAHVPQPIRKLPGGVDNQGMWVYYGIGNLLSAMTPTRNGIGSQVGQIAFPTITVPAEGRPYVSKAGWIPLVLDRSTVQVLPGYLYENGSKTGTRLSPATAAKYLAHVRKVTETQATELKDAPPADSITTITLIN